MLFVRGILDRHIAALPHGLVVEHLSARSLLEAYAACGVPRGCSSRSACRNVAAYQYRYMLRVDNVPGTRLLLYTDADGSGPIKVWLEELQHPESHIYKESDDGEEDQ